MLAGAIVNHRTHLIVDDNQLVDAGAAAVTATRAFTSGPVQNGGWILGAQVQEPPLVLACLKRLFGIRIEHAHEALREHSDEAG